MDSKPRRFMVGVATFVLVASTGTIAWAHHGHDTIYKTRGYDRNCTDAAVGEYIYGPRFCQTDNAAMSIYIQGSISANGRNSINIRLTEEYEPTDLDVIFASSGVYSGGAETDVIYQERGNDLPAQFVALTWCNDASGSTTCDQHYVAFDTATPLPYTTCHETGHAVGLTHGDVGGPPTSNTDSALACLRVPYSSTYPATLGTHNRSQINGTY